MYFCLQRKEVVLPVHGILGVLLPAERPGDSSVCREALVVVLPAHGVRGVLLPAKKARGGGGCSASVWSIRDISSSEKARGKFCLYMKY